MTHLRDYQLQVVSETIHALKYNRRVVVACPTGAGKTVIAMRGIVPELNGLTAWITHRTELAKQAKKHKSGITVLMAQGPINGDFANVIIDEGHHVCAKQYKRILTKYPQANIIALTATPYRLDGVGLGSCGFSHIIHGPDIYDLTKRGILCGARVFIPASESTKSWSSKPAAERIAKTRFKKAVVFCRSVKEAQQIAAFLCQIGIKAESVDGDTDAKTRNSIFRRFAHGKMQVVCNHTIFTEGVDVPMVDLIVLNRHTWSRCLWKQMIGRGLRTHPGKEECTVLDLAGNGVIHGSIYDKEIYDLHGGVESTEGREHCLTLEGKSETETETEDYNHNQGEQLKEWKPQPKPVRIIESLHRLKFKSPLRRLKTA